MGVIAKRISILAVVASFLGVGHTAWADSFVPVPAAKGKSNKNLKMRFVKYDGGTNGQMVIEVKNTAATKRSFSADGIYFVPKGKPENAPQRLGASGPMLVMTGQKVSAKSTKKLTLAPGETKKIRLEVFCIDSHRSSPNRSTKFAIAAKLLPKKLRRKLHTGNSRIYRRYKGNLKKAKSAIQSNMWKTRDADWIKLEGERKNEKSQKVQRRQLRRYRHRLHRRQIQQRNAP